MELGGIIDYLKGKSILITGSTGFLAKIFVEKVLRVQPEVKKLYLLVRAADTMSAAQRVQNEVISKELFEVLKEKHGKEFNSFISEKVSAVAGDIVRENLGIEDTDLRETLWNEIDVVVNVAATTNFYERYDVALAINVVGAKHVLEFAKKCINLVMFLHVSTAYVAGVQEGLILEKSFHVGETLKEHLQLDIEEELRLAEERRKEITFEQPTKHAEKLAMKEFGLERAKNFGWPNTYVFTKAMGEMLLKQLRGSLPLVIVRPTIITSTLKEPFPGWVEGTRTIDSFIIGYAKGKLPCCFGDPESIMDLIPGDMVVNAMIVAMVAHSNQQSEFIYHSSSSVRNPVKLFTFMDCGYHYFLKYPRIGKNGEMIKTHNVPLLKMADFRRYMTLRYRLPLEGLHVINVVFCHLFSQRYNEQHSKYKYVMSLLDLYEPYAFFKGCFDDTKLKNLRAMVGKYNGDEAKMFEFDPTHINWEEYFSKIHIPSVLKYVLK